MISGANDVRSPYGATGGLACIVERGATDNRAGSFVNTIDHVYNISISVGSLTHVAPREVLRSRCLGSTNTRSYIHRKSTTYFSCCIRTHRMAPPISIEMGRAFTRGGYQDRRMRRRTKHIPPKSAGPLNKIRLEASGTTLVGAGENASP